MSWFDWPGVKWLVRRSWPDELGSIRIGVRSIRHAVISLTIVLASLVLFVEYMTVWFESSITILLGLSHLHVTIFSLEPVSHSLVSLSSTGKSSRLRLSRQS